MNPLSILKPILKADTTLMSYATGSGYDYDETGQRGINFDKHKATAFDAQGRIKPCWMLSARDAHAWGPVVDEVSRVRSQMQIVEIRFYQDHATDQIELMRARVRFLLDMQGFTGIARCLWALDVLPKPWAELNCLYARSDYQLILVS